MSKGGGRINRVSKMKRIGQKSRLNKNPKHQSFDNAEYLRIADGQYAPHEPHNDSHMKRKPEIPNHHKEIPVSKSGYKHDDKDAIIKKMKKQNKKA